MNLTQVKAYVSGVLKGWFKNKPTLDKISESSEGNILFNGKELSVKVNSNSSDNLIQEDGNGLVILTSETIQREIASMLQNSSNVTYSTEDNYYLLTSDKYIYGIDLSEEE